jgi:hypothetical protein
MALRKKLKSKFENIAEARKLTKAQKEKDVIAGRFITAEYGLLDSYTKFDLSKKPAFQEGSGFVINNAYPSYSAPAENLGKYDAREIGTYKRLHEICFQLNIQVTTGQDSINFNFEKPYESSDDAYFFKPNIQLKFPRA